MNKDYEKIDKKELAKQMIEETLKGNHVMLQIVLGEGSTDPICLMATKGATFKEIGVLYNCLEEMKKTIKNRYPASVLYAKEFLEIDGKTEIDLNK